MSSTTIGLRRCGGRSAWRLPDWPLVVAAARLKAAGGISYADAFCVASAERHQVPLYTGDPEILALQIPVQRIDLRGS